MTGWNEDNFLEKLLADLRKKRGAERGPCPDAETLCAVLEGEAPAPLRQRVLEHVRRCPNCAYLQNRLLNFEAAASPEPEAVWKETQKRLDNWLEGFLRSRAANLRAARATSATRSSPGWESLWSFLNSRQLIWGLGTIALALFIADAVLVLELRLQQHAQITAQSAAPQSQATNAQPMATTPSAPAPSRGGSSEVSRAPMAGTGLSPRRTAETSGRVLNAQAAPTPTPQAPIRAAGPAAESRAAKARPTGAVTSGRFADASMRSPSAPQPKVAEAPVPFLRLDPGAHLLAALSSAKQLPNGSFEFRGTLLLPVAHAGSTALDQGAELVGAGQTRDGKTSLAVMEFVVQGARYILKEGSGAMKAQTPGTGGAVQFERSQVLEMWPASSLVYEKAPDAAAPARIQLGQTVQDVVTLLGQPERIVNLGSKQIYVYKDLKITFIDGKVSDVQ